MKQATFATRNLMSRVLLVTVMFLLGCNSQPRDTETQGSDAFGANDDWERNFDFENMTLVTTGKSKYFVLQPGFQQVFEGGRKKLVITVLDETEQVGEFTTRVIEEREDKDGQLYEVSRNFFAMCEETGDVFYFGEDVDFYKGGVVVDHSGAWRADEDNFKPGLLIQGNPVIGAKYYQELAPGKALDRAEVLSLTETMETPAGTFTGCLQTRETSGLKPKENELKTYAPGIGLIQDKNLLLTRYGFAKN